MPQRIENTQQNQPRRPRDRERDRHPAKHLLRDRSVRRQFAVVPQIALRREGEIEEDGRDDAAGDEERFEALGADVGDVGYVLAAVEGCVVRVAFGEPGYQHGEEHPCGGSAVSGDFVGGDF